ncbi:contactin-like isoform X1 [Mizuhopecten yessoensis]|uniref:contactin-like isoform X1 n=1 Tax=Mizuhopecten yessoensis TaxID=6573 RepID=UPI000B45F016|nr:contactin-like isoform X1 [Mizuhopecten yessoensis]XP_021356953.1 contactin-like isoform X1 [Mizuhopecten yessoensis]
MFWITLLLTASPIWGQTYDCPQDWFEHGDHCYHFSFNPLKTYLQAKELCEDYGAALLSIETTSEDVFIKNWLSQRDQAKNLWFTSGVYLGDGMFVWQSTGAELIDHLDYWTSINHMLKTGANIVYGYSGSSQSYGWMRTDGTHSLSYICEIPRKEVYRIIQEARDYSYGTFYTNPSLVPRGPEMYINPIDTEILGKTRLVFLECEAKGLPQPTYTWTRNSSQDVITPTTDIRYTLTNGRLSIQDPTESKDAGQYQCEAENRFGKIISAPVFLSFAFLGDFTNVDRAPTRPAEYSGAILECPTLQARSKAGLTYQWKRGREFIITDLNNYMFISQDGKLYFSEVTRSDNGEYYCITTLSSPSDSRNYIGSAQVPSRISREVNLDVIAQPSSEAAVQIQDSFIQVFPKIPIAGQTIALECFAYGSGNLKYSWTTPGKQDDRFSLLDSSRVLTIANARLGDSGTYSCTVRSRKTDTFGTKMFTLSIEAKPFFTLPLKSQHVGTGKQLTWRCEARSIPRAVYTWYKNGEPLLNTSDIVVIRNTLVIPALEKKHSGMYQCSADNIHGTTMSSAQLRVLEFPPTFNKSPLPSSMMGARLGNITIACNPEAAPYPMFTWLFGGNDMSLREGDTTSRIRMLANGDLLLTRLVDADGGVYTCKVENSLGSAMSTTNLKILTRTSISVPPVKREVIVNNTVFIPCRASHDPALDLIYTWQLNGHNLDVQRDTTYQLGGDGRGGLYIRSAQFRHQGEYTCTASTPVDQDFASSTLTVLGPPGEPAGVYNDIASPPPNPRTVRIKWSDGKLNGPPITFYMIEAKTNYSSKWYLQTMNVSYSSAIVVGDSDKRSALVDNLKPGVAYRFRVVAVNQYGFGTPSIPTDYKTIPAAPPEVPPKMVGGGGGKVGELRITWKPLPPEDQFGWGIGYLVEWKLRQIDIGTSRSMWAQARVYGNKSEYSTTVGADLPYVEYEVRVTPFNMFGDGKATLTAFIYSAEGLPVSTPTKVYADSYNSTAVSVHWKPVKNTIQSMKGRLRGYKVNYWLREGGDEMHAIQAIFYGDIDHAIIIGLLPDTWYYFNVQVFNTAGNGQKSEKYPQETDRYRPMRYPTEVHVHSHSTESAKVTFRGISTQVEEEPLRGYMIKYWETSDDIRQAKTLDVEKANAGIIYGLKKGIVYKLRVLGYSQGGEGKMSSPATLFTMAGGSIPYDPTSTDIMAAASSLSVSTTITVICTIASLVLFLI